MPTKLEKIEKTEGQVEEISLVALATNLVEAADKLLMAALTLAALEGEKEPSSVLAGILEAIKEIKREKSNLPYTALPYTALPYTTVADGASSDAHPKKWGGGWKVKKPYWSAQLGDGKNPVIPVIAIEEDASAGILTNLVHSVSGLSESASMLTQFLNKQGSKKAP